jgi:tRNA-(ms[2]io[6]A)-hydroxylase
VLRLASITEESWLERVLPHRDALLLEQAHLERKAASVALTLMFTYQELAVIQQPLSELAREELEHHERALALLGRRGLAFARQVPSRYFGRLHAIVRKREPERGLDAMLVSALIEARSFERMKLLAEALGDIDPEVAEFYRGLLASEARHHSLYVDLAQVCFPQHDVMARLAEVAAHEALVLSEGPPEARLHG